MVQTKSHKYYKRSKKEEAAKKATMLFEKFGLINPRQSTFAVIAWFKDFPNKERCKFLTFDDVDFYLSILEKLLNNALIFAKQFLTISKDSINIIHHCRKSLFFSRDSVWIKNDGLLFDVTMGLCNRAEVCELVCLFILNFIALLVSKNNVGLYRDDGLAILENASGLDSKSIKNKSYSFFNNMA